MLVLSRKQNQSIVINGNIRITVVSIRGNQVRTWYRSSDVGADLPRGTLRAGARARL